MFFVQSQHAVLLLQTSSLSVQGYGWLLREPLRLNPAGTSDPLADRCRGLFAAAADHVIIAHCGHLDPDVEAIDERAAYAPYVTLYRRASADALALTNIDVLEHFDFDITEAERLAREIQPDIEVMRLSAKTGEGIGGWLEFLQRKREARLAIP